MLCKNSLTPAAGGPAAELAGSWVPEELLPFALLFILCHFPQTD